jgi:hypothetical protein
LTKRLPFRLLACFLCGALITVVIAWGFALWGLAATTASVQYLYLEGGRIVDRYPRTLTDLSHLPWRLSDLPQQCWIDVTSYRGRGLEDTDFNWVQTDQLPRHTGLRRHRAGWPALAMRCERNWSSEASGDWYPISYGLTPPHWTTRERYFEDIGSPGLRPPLPVLPEPKGFALDTLFYGALLFCLFLLARRLRGTLRTRRGRCPDCGYVLSGLPQSSACPECGTPRA